MDIKLVSTVNGSDLELKGNDLTIINGFQNMIYLALFGGNIEESTKVYEPTEQRLDWWSNNTFDFDNKAVQMNSRLERELNRIVLNSSGRSKIEQIVNQDLKFMKAFAKVDVTVAITDVDRLEILIKVKEPTKLNANEYVFLWDSTNKEITIK